MKTTYLVVGIAIVVVLAVCLTQGHGKPAGSAALAQEPDNPQRGPDDAAIRKVSSEFTEALGKGDAKAVAGYWTEQGEYIADAGTTIRGRAAIEKAYAKTFEKAPHLKVDVQIDSIRFISQDNAIEEGHARVQKGEAALPAASRYSVLYARENGQWRIALLREWPAEGASLRDLDWLIGTWTGKTENGEVQTTYEWDRNKKFINARFTIKGPEHTASGMQIIARDPSTGNLRSWLFESEGGFGGATWTLNGKRWLIDAAGVEADGAEMTATNILTPLNKDSFTWQSVDRTVDGEEQPSIPPIKVTRVK